MAKLHPEPYPGDWGWKQGEDFNKCFERERELLAAITEPTVRFPVGDGQALYVVKSFKPLVLQHVPFGDAYQISDAYIRGLRATDVRQLIKRDEAMRKVFSNRKDREKSAV